LPLPGFNGLKVLSLESRRAVEMSRLIENYGGQPVSAPAMREVPLAHNENAVAFARGLIAGQFDLVIFLTGVGARALLQAITEAQLGEPFLQALGRVEVAVRGPKPLAVLREWKIPVALTAPEPCTWRELLGVLVDSHPRLNGVRVVVQEYGVSSVEFVAALRERGAIVKEVAVYHWELPEDTSPLRATVSALIGKHIDVALFTTGVQAVDLETSHPKMGILVKETAEQSAALASSKRAN